MRLTVPTFLQIGWIESPPYFCAAYENARYLDQQYVKTPVGIFSNHKFVKNSAQGDDFELLPETGSEKLHYVIECFVYDYIYLVIPTSQEQLRHVSNAVMNGIHEVFPAYVDDE